MSAGPKTAVHPATSRCPSVTPLSRSGAESYHRVGSKKLNRRHPSTKSCLANRPTQAKTGLEWAHPPSPSRVSLRTQYNVGMGRKNQREEEEKIMAYVSSVFPTFLDGL